MTGPRTEFNGADFDGVCELTMTGGTPPAFEDQLLVGRADPRVKITGEFINEALAKPCRVHGAPYVELDGDLLRINGDNRTVVYRLVCHDTSTDLYYGEWPD